MINSILKKYNKVTTFKKIQNLIKDHFNEKKFKKIKILEFGVDKGISTSLFLKFCKDTKSKLFSVDIIDYSKLIKHKSWKFLQSRDDNFKKVNNFVNWPVDVIFLDTEHTAKHVEKIFYMYIKKLKIGGLFIIDDISWLPYHKNGWRNNEWIENNNKDTFKKLIEIYNNNQKNLKLYFSFEESGLAVITKKTMKINFPEKIPSREYSPKNILRKLFK
jgi:predicted O-methyltransferase YrrM